MAREMVRVLLLKVLEAGVGITDLTFIFIKGGDRMCLKNK